LRPAFERFYAEYPRKADRDDAERAFTKAIARLVQDGRDETAAAEFLAERAAAFSKQCTAAETEQQFIKLPATWLNKGSYLDENLDSFAAVANGQVVDLSRMLDCDTTLRPIFVDSEEGLDVLRHSTAHVMAQAVQELFPEAKLGIGPPVKDGFYYDFDVATPFTPEDLAAIEAKMVAILKSGQRFERRVVSESEAVLELAAEPYKLRLIGSEGGAEVMEVGGSELTIYDNVNPKTGERCWGDLCRGPHVPDTRYIPTNAIKLMRSAAAYWLGDQRNEQLQRVYGTAWPSKEALKAHLSFLEEAERRDHRRLGAELDLFSFPEQIGSGLAVFHPKGGVVRRVMEDYSRQAHEAGGYEFVNSPHITKGALFELSGHLDWYAEGMYPPMQLDADIDENGHVHRQGVDYYLKPMNCPMHNLIFDARGRSYRELPLRLFEFGTVYRYEKSGVVHGLTRVRGMTQDDSHIFTTKEQMVEEIRSLLDFVLDLLRDYGLDDFYLELSTKPEEKFVGSDEEWDEATEALRVAASGKDLDLVMDPGGGAFYGPKISVQARDSIGRTWQMLTIQLDFQTPQRFDIHYIGADNERHRPVMIHRALFGSIERFFAVLLEHYAGAFPLWLAPVQATVLPVADRHDAYAFRVVDRLKSQGFRPEMVDGGHGALGARIRRAKMEKVPYVLVVGDDDAEHGTVGVNKRGTNDPERGVALDDLVERFAAEVAEHA
jgi:threonyl-tRNA synthetase